MDCRVALGGTLHAGALDDAFEVGAGDRGGADAGGWMVVGWGEHEHIVCTESQSFGDSISVDMDCYGDTIWYANVRLLAAQLICFVTEL